MREIKDLENYIEVLLNTNEPNGKIKGEIPNIQLLLYVYMLGLQKEDFYPELLLKKLLLENTPAQFHTLIAQLSIIKGSEPEKNERPTQYLLQSTTKLLKEFKNYFSLLD